MPRPRHFTADECAVAYDWLAANGVDEWIPENPKIDVAGGKLWFDCYRWADGAGDRWNPDNMVVGDDAVVIRERRSVPLLAPLTDEVRAALAASGATLAER